MKNRIRFFSFFAFLLLSIWLLTLPVLAGQTYPVWIGSKQISTSNMSDVLQDGTVSYTPASSVSPAILHLKNAHLTESTETETQIIDGHEVYFNELCSYIWAKEDLIIDLTGNNQIGPASFTRASLESAVNYGIRTTDYSNYFYSVCLQGSGNLTICEKYTGILAKSIVIDMNGKLRIEEFGDPGLACCLKTVTPGTPMYNSGTTFLKNGNVTLHSFRSNGVYGDLQISGGTIQAYAENESGYENLAMKSVPTYANGYKSYIYLGKTPGTSKYIASPSAADILNANFIFITFIPPAKKTFGTIKLIPETIVYNGEVQKPSVSVYDADNNLLEAGKDYTVSFNESKKAGKYTATITGIGDYTGIRSQTYTIIPKPVKTITCKRNGTEINVSWKYTASQCSGYQIQYAKNKKFNQAKSKTIKSATTKKTTLKNLSKTKTYYVRIRAYKTVNGEKIYSDWSKTKTVKKS